MGAHDMSLADRLSEAKKKGFNFNDAAQAIGNINEETLMGAAKGTIPLTDD